MVLAWTGKYIGTETGEICNEIDEQRYSYLSLPIVGIECCGSPLLE